MYAKSTKTIAKIFRAARSLFVSNNYADVTMSDLAIKAGVTKGALYHHFSSKDELYLRMMHDYLQEIETLAQTTVDSEGSVRERLHCLTLSFLSLSPQKQKLMKLVRRDINAFSGAERQELVRAYQRALPEKAEVIIRDGIRLGEITNGDARLLSWEHVAMVEVVLGTYARKQLGDPEDMAGFVTHLFFDGVGHSDT